MFLLNLMIKAKTASIIITQIRYQAKKTYVHQNSASIRVLAEAPCKMSTESPNTPGKKLSQLRVIDLREELEKRGLEKTGVKAALMERLKKVNPPHSDKVLYCSSLVRIQHGVLLASKRVKNSDILCTVVNGERWLKR